MVDWSDHNVKSKSGFRSGVAELLERIEQLEQKLSRAGGVLKPPRGRKRVEAKQQTL
jgi:hypothetical protein